MWLLALTLLAVSLTPVAAKCDACFYSNCFKKVIVLERYEQIGQLDIDRTDNIFYFHVKNSQSKSFSIALDLDHVSMTDIDVDFTFARAVDRSTRDLYISTESSVVKSNPKNNFTHIETVFNKTVWHLQFKNKLFYVEFGVRGLQYYENGEHKSISALSSYQIDDFVVDKNNDIYFLADFAIYRLKNNQTRATIFADDIYVLSLDRNDEVSLAQSYQKAFYKVDYERDQMVEIGALNVGTPFTFVFTSENYIIYSDIKLNGMYLLVPTAGTCKITQSGQGKDLTKSVSIDV